MTTKKLASQMFAAALSVIEWAEGDVELARQAWNEAFEEAERIDHNQSMGEPDESRSRGRRPGGTVRSRGRRPGGTA